MARSFRTRSGVTIYQYYQISWLGLVVTSLILSGSSRIVPYWLVFLGLPLSILCLASRPFGTWWTPAIRARSAAYFAVVTILFGAYDFSVHHDIFLAAGELLIGILPILLSRKHRPFGHWMALLTSALLSLIGVIGSSGLPEYTLLLLFLAFLVFNLNAANLLALIGNTGGKTQSLPRRYFRQLVPSLTWGLLAGILIFFAFPRTPRFWNPFSIRQRGGSMTGYTGTVSLASTAPIEESSEQALLIEAEDSEWLMRRTTNMYVRGNTLDKFDGQDWSASSRVVWPYTQGADLRFTLSSRLPAKKLKIFREPHSTQAVLYPDVLLGITVPQATVGTLSYDASGSLIRGHREEIRYSYEVLASEPIWPAQMRVVTLAELKRVLGKQSEEMPLPAGMIPGLSDYLLDVPDSVARESYFQEWVKELEVDKENATLLSVLNKLERHFQTSFRATLARQDHSQDTFRSFLQKERAGHCEYFATAAVLFLRQLGIPSRIVLGYRGGTFNGVSRVLEVRERNAHAWVEVYYPMIGWIQFDPTPWQRLPEDTGLAFYVGLYMNAGRFWFNRYVVNYNTQAQRDLFRSVAKMASSNQQVSMFVPMNMRTLESLLVLIVLILYCMKIMRRHHVRNSRRRHLPEYYELFLKKIAETGWDRKPGETFAAYHRRLMTGGVRANFLKELDAALESDLYAPQPTPEHESKTLKALLTRWKAPRRPLVTRSAS